MNRTCTECPAVLPAKADPRKLTCSRACQNNRRTRLRREARDASPLPGGRNRENYTRGVDLAAMHGVAPSAVRSWLYKNNHPYVVERKQIWLSNRLADQYTREREARLPNPLPRRPRGWKSLKQLAGTLNVSVSTARTTLREAPGIRHGTFGMTIYVHPEDAEWLRLQASSEAPLPGWIALADLAAEFNRRLSGLHLVADRLGVELHWATKPGVRPTRHVTPEGAAVLRAWNRTASRREFKPRRRREREEVNHL